MTRTHRVRVRADDRKEKLRCTIDATSLVLDRRVDMTTPREEWFDFGPGHGALEFDERFTCGVGFELHLVIDSETSEKIAWWEREGEWFAAASVGRA